VSGPGAHPVVSLLNRPINGDRSVARKKSKSKGAAFMAFNVVYEDGSVTSNRRVSNDLLDQTFGDLLEDLVKSVISDQDNEIAQRSGQRRAKIKSITKV
jgi:hypothetical protein